MGARKAFTPPGQLDSRRSEQITAGIVEKIHYLDPAKIEPNPYQPRKFFDPDAIEELAREIQSNGQLQPVVVIDTGSRYVLIAGERRVRACLSANMTVKAIVESGSEETLEKDSTRILRSAIMENIKREDLTYIERAESLYKLSQAPEYVNMNRKEFAAEIGISYTTYNRLMDILNLSPYIKERIRGNNSVSIQALENLSRLDDNTANAVFDQIITEGLNAEQSNELIRNSKNDKRGEGAKIVKDKKPNESLWCGLIKTTPKKITFELDPKKLDESAILEIRAIIEKYKAKDE